jgi:cardiolipin synthase
LNYRTHRKILVVDGSVAFTGGVGIADHWLGNAQDPQHWRDTHVLIKGPSRANPRGRVLRELRRWWVHGHPVLTDSGRAHDADDHSMVVRSSPSDGASDLKRLYLLAIAMARRSNRDQLAILRHRRIHDVGLAMRVSEA